jgi:hypothetical protein
VLALSNAAIAKRQFITERTVEAPTHADLPEAVSGGERSHTSEGAGSPGVPAITRLRMDVTPTTRGCTSRDQSEVMCSPAAVPAAARAPARLAPAQKSLLKAAMAAFRRVLTSDHIPDRSTTKTQERGPTSVSAGQPRCGAPAGIELAAPSLPPWIGGQAPCYPASSQVDRHRRRHSYGLSYELVKGPRRVRVLDLPPNAPNSNP